MKSSLEEVVRVVVARHLDVTPNAIAMELRAQEDLELDPLDLVLIALRLEEIERIEFPMARLEHVVTVSDLVETTRLACEEQRAAPRVVTRLRRSAMRRRAAAGAFVLALGGLARTATAETAPPDAQAPAEPAPKDDGADRSDEALRVGAFGGVGFPRPLSIEGMIKVKRVLGFGLEYSALPSMTVSGVDASFWALEGDVSGPGVSEATSVASIFGKTVLPTVDLLRVGLML